jgi:photosystem II stability/assembly factor-like uncharacterized protein
MAGGMRKKILFTLTLFLSLFLINSGFAQINQTWKWMHPKPTGNTLRWVKMFSATNWVAVGYAGTFMSTTNGGSTWTHYTNAGGQQAGYLQGRFLYSGWFFDMNTGVVCGSSGWIGRTTNGGQTWDSLGGGGTATLYGIHFVNTTTGFIGGTSGTILKSTNAGVTWTALTSGTTSAIYNIFALDANRIYAPSSSGYLRISTDGGANWTQYTTGGSTLYDVNFLNTTTGFVTGSSGHVRRTTDGGSNWVGVNTPYTSTLYEIKTVAGGGPSTPYFEGFESVTFPPTGWRRVNVAGPSYEWVRTTTQFHSGIASAWMTYDCINYAVDWLITPQWSIVAGDSLVFWMRLQDIGFAPDSLAVRVSTTDTALASFTNRILYLAEGVNYPPTNTSWYRYGASLNAFAGQNIYIGFKHADNCGDGIYIDDVAVNRYAASSDVYVVGDPFNLYKTTNLGTNWTTIPHLDPGQAWTSTFYSMDMNGTIMTAVGANGLFNRSTNSGANWTTFTQWISAGTFYDVWVEFNDRKVWVVGSPGISGTTFDQILYSTNGGITWANQSINSTRYFRGISMVNTSIGYIAGSSGAVRKTTNGGTSWDSLPFPSTSVLYAVDFPNASTGWVVSTSSPYVWKTVDGGLNWPSQTGPTTSVYDIDMFDANTGWMVGSSGSVRRTTDGGTTWTLQTSGTTSTLYCVKALNATTGFVSGSSGAVRKTTDGGTTWSGLTTPYSTTFYATDWWNVNNGIVVGSSGYTTKTTDGGTTWSIQQNTSGSTMYNVFMRHHDSAWAVGSGAYAFKWATGIVGTTTWGNEVPKTYFLSQNYPNPFNPVTTIKFGIPKAGSVTLNVYDITGRLVRAIFNNTPLNAGVVTHSFDGSSLASGIYFYTLIVNNDKIDTKRMVLVK